ncbi:MAG: sugar phosphate isomerase/epimerase, partial [Planctomycetota bacterium]
AAHGLLFGLEVEANLVGRTGGLLKEIHAQLADAALVLIYDVGNLITQGFSPDATYAEYEAMKPGLGWVHVKDYRPLTEPTDTAGYVEEDALSDYRAVDAGSGVYQRVIADLKDDFDAHAAKAEKLGLAGPLFDLEPHVRGGGQYGGYSGPDGLGVAMRALCSALEEAGCTHDRRGTVEPL